MKLKQEQIYHLIDLLELDIIRLETNYLNWDEKLTKKVIEFNSKIIKKLNKELEQ